MAGAGVAGFFLSVFNTIQTARREKSKQRLDEYRSSVRDPIRTATGLLPPLARRLDAVANTQKSINDLIEDVNALNEEVAAAIGQVIDALAEANRSRFAKGTDWNDGVFDYEDSILDQFNTARDEKCGQAARLMAVGEAARQIRELQAKVNSRVDDRAAL